MDENLIITEKEMANANMVSKPYDSVFHMLFRDKNYLLQMYQALHPEDMETNVEDLKILFYNKAVLKDFVNDLSFLAKDKILILFEAQSTECGNMPLRLLIYLAKSLIDYIAEKGYNLFRKNPVELPKLELYVLYTCEVEQRVERISFAETYFPKGICPVDLKVNVLYGDEKQSIIQEYVTFCKVLKEQVQIYGANERAVAATITICKDKGILENFLRKMEQEVARVVVDLFNEEWFIRDVKIEAKEEQAIETAKRMLDKGYGRKEIAEVTALDISTVEKLAAEMTKEN